MLPPSMKSGRVGVATQHLHGADSYRRLAAAGRHRRARSLLDNKAPRASLLPCGWEAGGASHQEPTSTLNLQRDSLIVVLGARRQFLEGSEREKGSENWSRCCRKDCAGIQEAGSALRLRTSYAEATELLRDSAADAPRRKQRSRSAAAAHRVFASLQCRRRAAAAAVAPRQTRSRGAPTVSQRRRVAKTSLWIAAGSVRASDARKRG
jgi:hypothetical protein